MGDRCHISVSCRSEHRETFESLGFYDDGEVEPGIHVMINDECYSTALDVASGRGIPFTAESGEGDEYGAFAYACAGREVYDVATTHEGVPALPVSFDPVKAEVLVDQAEADQAKLYFQVKLEAEAMMKAPATAAEVEQ